MRLRNRRQFFLLAALSLASLGLCLYGVDAGLPKAAVQSALFSDPAELEMLKPALISLRERIYRSYDESGNSVFFEIYDQKNRADRIPIDLGKGRSLQLPEAQLNYIRGFFLQSSIPDEQLTIRALSRMRPSKFDFNPHFFQYGGGYLYFAGAILKAASVARLVHLTSDIGFYLSHPEQSALIYKIPKIAAGIVISLAVFPFFFAVRRWFDEPSAWAAALFFALAPVFKVESRILKPFGYNVFFLSLALIFLARSLESRKGKDYLLAGLFCGLSAGTLYPTAFLAFALAGAVLAKGRAGFWISLSLALIGCGVGFLAVNPYWLLSFAEFHREMGLQSERLILRPSLEFFTAGAHAVGWPVWLLSWIGFAGLVARRHDARSLVFSGLYGICLLSLSLILFPAHYGAPIFLLSIALAGYGAAHLFGPGALRARQSVLAGAALLALAQSCYYATLFAAPEPHEQAGRWMNRNLPEGSTIRLLHTASCVSPPFRSLRYRPTFAEEGNAAEEFVVIPSAPGELRPSRDYAAVAHFSRHSPLDRYFSNHLLPWLDCTTTIFKRRS